MPNPILWPIAGASAAAQNAVYDTRRQRVVRHVANTYPHLLAEIDAGSGAALAKAMDLARVRPERRPVLRARLKADLALYRQDRDALVVALMVHGG